MPKLEYFLVSEGVSVDQRTNKASIFDVCEEIIIPGLVPHLVAISSWNIGPDEREKDFQATLRVRLNGESVSKELDGFKINFTTEQGERHRIFHYINGLRLEKPGILEFEVLLDGQRCACHTVTVRAQAETD
jgi:hypothetical protein